MKLRDGSKVKDARLARLQQFDKRSLGYPVKAVVGGKPLRSYTWSCGKWLDQGQEGACVGFAWTHELIARPAVVTGVAAAFAREKVYWEAQKIDPWEGGCVDMETTCLTAKGWVNADSLQVGDEILTFDIESECMRWAPVEAIHRHEMPYREWSHKQFKCAVTDNHRWAVRTRNTGESWHRYFRMTTTEAWKSADSVPRAMPSGDLPSDLRWEDDFVELVAWAICEGHYRKPSPKNPHSVDVYQKVELERVQGLMQRLGVAPGSTSKDGCHVWTVCGSLGEQLHGLKNFMALVAWFRTLTLRQLRLFIEVCVLGDGTEQEAQGTRRERGSFIQRDNEYLDAFLAACAMAGQPVNRRYQGGGSNGDVESWTLRHSNDVEVRGLEPKPYVVGRVWCPQTRFGTFVARRDGFVFITGNSYPGASPFYEGTSVLAGAKIIQKLGYIKEYRWAFGVEELALAVGYCGPAVLGIPWYEGMFEPMGCGFLHIGGGLAGGHSILCHGVDAKQKLFKLHNSWGKSWGTNGEALVTWDEMDRLLHEGGEACIPMGRSR